MNTNRLIFVTMLISLLAAAPFLAEGAGPIGSGWRQGGTEESNSPPAVYGSRGGMILRNPIALEVPDKLPVPKNAEWLKSLREVLGLERLAHAQYVRGARRFGMDGLYRTVIPQKEDHVRAIEQMVKAYGLPAESKELSPREAGTAKESYKNGVELEKDIIARYEWLSNNAEDQRSAGILRDILAQSRMHFTMLHRSLDEGTMSRRDNASPAARRAYEFMGARGYGYGRHKPGGGGPLGINDARIIVESYLLWTRNPNLKVGIIKDTPNGYEVQVVTRHYDLVDTIWVNKQTGRMTPQY